MKAMKATKAMKGKFVRQYDSGKHRVDYDRKSTKYKKGDRKGYNWKVTFTCDEIPVGRIAAGMERVAKRELKIHYVDLLGE